METRLPRFHLVQNHPFEPMVKAWKAGHRHIAPEDFPKGTQDRSCLSSLYANVLANRHPWYATEGGIYDILNASNGEMYGITEKAARQEGGRIFEQVEGIDLVPAAKVCMGGLIRAVERGNINRKDRVLVNITGGGQKRYERDVGRHYPHPDAIISSSKASDAELRGLFNE
jgi:cysteate synthase